MRRQSNFKGVSGVIIVEKTLRKIQGHGIMVAAEGFIAAALTL